MCLTRGVWCVETQSWDSTSAQVVTVLTHSNNMSCWVVKLLKLRVLTHGFTPVTSLQLSFACLSFLLLAGLGALLQLLFLSPLFPSQDGGHLPRMELLLKPLSGLLSATYSPIPSPNVPPGPIFLLFGWKPLFWGPGSCFLGSLRSLPCSGNFCGDTCAVGTLERAPWAQHVTDSPSATIQKVTSAGNSPVWEGKVCSEGARIWFWAPCAAVGAGCDGRGAAC